MNDRETGATLPDFQPRRRMSDLDHVYSQLSRSIMMGEVVPGQKLKLKELADVFHTSQMPVREALSRLVVSQVLEAAPRKSVTVPHVDAKRLEDLVSIRIDLECKALRQVASEPNQALANKLESINATMDKEAARKRPSIKNYLAVNHEFHFTIYEQSGNPDLTSIIEILWLRYGPLLNLLRNNGLNFAKHDHHEKIVRAVRVGNPELGVEGLTGDLMEAAVVIKNALEP